MFDLNNVPEQDFDLIPNGWYSMTVIEAEMKEANSGTEYLNLQFRIFGEKYEDRRVFTILNISHDKESVRNIALSQLKTLLKAIGSTKTTFPGTDDIIAEIVDKPFNGKVKTTKDKTGDYEDKNEVKGFKALSGDVANELPKEADASIPF